VVVVTKGGGPVPLGEHVLGLRDGEGRHCLDREPARAKPRAVSVSENCLDETSGGVPRTCGSRRGPAGFLPFRWEFNSTPDRVPAPPLRNRDATAADILMRATWRDEVTRATNVAFASKSPEGCRVGPREPMLDVTATDDD
jgi:hypothetical protein